MKFATFAFIATAATTIAMGTAGAQNAMGPSAAAPSKSTMTLQSIDPTKPFGSIDIAAADPSNPAKMTTWGKTLTDEQRAELANRCGVISQNTATFQSNAVTFCKGWESAQAETPDQGLGQPQTIAR